MDHFVEPPPFVEPNEPPVPPPLQFPPPPEAAGQKTKKKATGVAAALLALAAKAKAIFAALAVGLKFAGLGKVLLTGSTMLLSVWAYAQIFGLWFAVGFVVLIFVHEMGHVFAALKCGIKVSAPIFIPFMGALILTKRGNGKVKDAIVGIGGPVLGTVGSAVCGVIFLATGQTFFLGLAYVGFLLNLFNLTPIFPLDGGWIVRAISPVLWLIGVVVIVALLFLGHLWNPMVLVLVVLGIPTMWHEFRAMMRGTPSEVPSSFRLNMGLGYVGVIAACLLGMVWCESMIPPVRSSRANDADQQISMRAPSERSETALVARNFSHQLPHRPGEPAEAQARDLAFKER